MKTSSGHVLEFLVEYIEKHGWAPTVREICRELGFTSTSSAWWHLQHLEKCECIVRVAGSPRAIRIVNPEYFHVKRYLSAVDCAEIRARWVPGVRSGPRRRRSNAGRLAKEFGVSESRIRQICCGGSDA